MREKGCGEARTIHCLIYRPKDLDTEEPSFVLNEDSPASKAKPDRHRRMLDGRRGTGPRPAVLRQKGAGARRSRAIAAGQGRRLLHRSRAGRHADRGSSPGGGQSDRAPVDADSRGRAGSRAAITARCAWSSRDEIDAELVTGADQVLVGLNKTRRAYNKRLRELLGFRRALPEVGEKLVCLRNDKTKGLLNGAIFRVHKASGCAAARYRMSLIARGRPERQADPRRRAAGLFRGRRGRDILRPAARIRTNSITATR